MMARKEASVVELCHLASLFALSLGLARDGESTLAIGLATRDALLGDATAPTVVLAAATIPFTLIGQMATALLLRIGALRAYGWIVAAGAVVQFALVVGLEVGVGLTPELTMLAALMTIAAVGIALAVVLAGRVGPRALTPVSEWRLIRAALHIGIRLQPASVALWLNLKDRPPPRRPADHHPPGRPLLALGKPRRHRLHRDRRRSAWPRSRRRPRSTRRPRSPTRSTSSARTSASRSLLGLVAAAHLLPVHRPRLRLRMVRPASFPSSC